MGMWCFSSQNDSGSLNAPCLINFLAQRYIVCMLSYYTSYSNNWSTTASLRHVRNWLHVSCVEKQIVIIAK